MKIGIHSLYEVFNIENNIFKSDTYKIGENLEYPIVLLRNHIMSMGCSLDTLDIYPLEEFKKIIFLDYPKLTDDDLQKLIDLKIELYLVILESELIYPKNFDKKRHSLFKKIFTWADDLIDNDKYFKLNLCNKIPDNFSINLDQKIKFCANISGNKKSKLPNELYSERVKAIDWFEKNHPSDLDLYGFDWNKFTFTFPFSRLNKFTFLRNLFGKKYLVYKGSLEKKLETLKMYRFSICYENIKANNGYVSEKIFDCFFAGTIPIYLGEENIQNLIPSNTFIDKRFFVTYEELYEYISKMSLEEYKSYVNAIENFVNGDEIYPFSAECFVNVICENIELPIL